ncbi:hypothetical protein [Mycolicibacterium peregrinum]|uniref:Uncharacterized protein n=1 Tax=Mycolicibacterium peregrinum TaxID=43304 RepID=A0A1A0VU82_MYCPR|nr:hypothetical protein [Mycolicibacterium peregrinum]OBB86792.1 hypothetical protein A5779_00250 [Mycolicibacterium peregrinum]
MVTWTITTQRDNSEHVIIGSSENPVRARGDLAGAARCRIRAAAAGTAAGLPRYELRQAGHLVAIIQTGVNEAGLPDHAGATHILDQLAHPRNPFVA